MTRRSPRRSIGVEAAETLFLGLQPRYITLGQKYLWTQDRVSNYVQYLRQEFLDVDLPPAAADEKRNWKMGRVRGGARLTRQARVP